MLIYEGTKEGYRVMKKKIVKIVKSDSWMFHILIFLISVDRFGLWIIYFQSIVKYLPGAGWSMECGAYLFLDRSFDQDQRRIDALIDYYVSCGYNYQVSFIWGINACFTSMYPCILLFRNSWLNKLFVIYFV